MAKRSDLTALRAKAQEAKRQIAETQKTMRETEATLREEERKVHRQILLALGELVEHAGLAHYPTDTLAQEFKSLAVALETRTARGESDV